MHDAFLKSVFADRRMTEILIRRHAPEWASEIDFSTLREASTGLVSKKTLQRRHPDMIWSAATVKGERVLFLLEFQRTVERLMALRTTTYSALTLEGIAAGPDYKPGDLLPEFVYFVLYHGDGPWTAPAHVTDLFQRSDPGRYRLVPWGEGAGDDRPRDDLTALVLGLARNLSPAEMAVQLSGLWGTIEGHGDPDLAGLMVRSVDTMLELRDYPARLMKGGGKAMAEVVDRFKQGMEELVQKGEVRSMRRQVTRRFGEETAGQLSRLLDKLPGPDEVDRVTDALFECATGDEFIERVRMG
ncbi:MAG: Rpn family recombination-promoting nuclease/putative transposase [Gemmatimonadetes bacterium]|nr:Rpn family recombination-promoting nuclease/putative transposase [Gemmatimonadota bacterium]MYC91438.1 Rpn family recombination-promoting nuclease/putative transposase [Gemmatimonadota bacterium]